MLNYGGIKPHGPMLLIFFIGATPCDTHIKVITTYLGAIMKLGEYSWATLGLLGIACSFDGAILPRWPHYYWRSFVMVLEPTHSMTNSLFYLLLTWLMDLVT